jgi:quercetin dioxygenase-like cupin family protein
MTTTSVPHQTWNWDSIPKEPIAEGLVRQMIYGATLMICRLTFAPGTVTTPHDHFHGAKGQVRFVVGSEEKVFGPGDVLLFPGGFWHGATILDEEVVLVDIFSPLREDFLKPKSESAGA